MIRCPKCGERFDYREAVMDETWREIIGLLPNFGVHGKLVFEYVEKFDTNPLKAKSKKVLRLLSEIAKLYESGEFSMRKSTYSISKPGIIEALKITCNKNFSEPLENHNYLKKVMIGISERELKGKRDQADREQRERETRQKDGGQGSKLKAQSEKTQELEPVAYGDFAKKEMP